MKRRTEKLWKYIVFFLLCSLSLVSLAQTKRLQFQTESFKIMQLTDLHWCGGEAYAIRNDSTWHLIDEMLCVEKPQLVVLTGDVVVSTEVRKSWKRLAKLFKQHRTPWMVTFGNHDTEAEMPKQKVAELLASLPYCIMPQHQLPISGVGNSAVPVWNVAGTSVQWMLYFMDSHAYPSEKDMGVYDWIKADQIDWYRHERDNVQQNQAGSVVPAIAFFHIPLPEFAAGSELCTQVGNRREKVCCPLLNTGLFSVFLEKKDVAGVFCGHDHNNDYLLDFKGRIVLAYGRKTGYVSAYQEVLPRGVRIIELKHSGKSFRTYVRDLDGISQVYDFESRCSVLNKLTLRKKYYYE